MAKINFNPEDQRLIASTAAELFTEVEHSLPKVPWLSHRGQQEAYLDTVKVISGKIDEIDADIKSKKAIEFWLLNIIYANNRKFRVAVTAYQSLCIRGISPANTFPITVKSNINPRYVVADEMNSWMDRRNTIYEIYT